MIRIDLLPGWVKEQKKIKTMVLLFIVLLVIEVAALMFVQHQANGVLADKNAKIASLKSAKTAADAVASELASTQGQIQPYKLRVQFAKDVMEFNKQWREAVECVFPYISSEAVVKQFDCDGKTINFSGYASSFEQLVRFYFNLKRCPALSNIQVTDTRGVDSPGNWVDISDLLNNLLVKRDVPYQFRVSATLAKPVKRPQPPGGSGAAAGGAAAGGGMPGMPGMGGGMPGMPGMGGGMPGMGGGMPMPGMNGGAPSGGSSAKKS